MKIITTNYYYHRWKCHQFIESMANVTEAPKGGISEKEEEKGEWW